MNLDRLSITDLARLTGVSRWTITRWRAADPSFPEPAHGRTGWRWDEVRAWWLGRRGPAVEAGGASPTRAAVPPVGESRARKLAAEAALAELRLERERVEHVPASAMAERVHAILGRVDAELSAQPARRAAQLADRAGIPVAEARRLLVRTVEAVRAELRGLAEVGGNGSGGG